MLRENARFSYFQQANEGVRALCCIYLRVCWFGCFCRGVFRFYSCIFAKSHCDLVLFFQSFGGLFCTGQILVISLGAVFWSHHFYMAFIYIFIVLKYA